MNPELEEQLELERLIAEQEKDDHAVEMSHEPGHREDVSFDGLDSAMYVTDTYFEGTKDEHSSFEDAIPLPKEKGTVLVGSAPYHGTLAGYVKQECRCERCSAAHRDYKREYMRSYRARKREEAQSHE